MHRHGGHMAGYWKYRSTTTRGSDGRALPVESLGRHFQLSAWAPVVLTALKQYGMFLSDIGTEGTITASSDVTEDPEVTSELATIGNSRISYTNLEVVDESSLMLSRDSSAVNPNNPYQKPANYALLTVVDAGNPANQVQVPIAIQPVTVGTPILP